MTLLQPQLSQASKAEVCFCKNVWAAFSPEQMATPSLRQSSPAAHTGAFLFSFNPFGINFKRALLSFPKLKIRIWDNAHHDQAVFTCVLFLFFVFSHQCDAQMLSTTTITIKYCSIHSVQPQTPSHVRSLGFNRPCRWFSTLRTVVSCVQSWVPTPEFPT